jgi:Protein of unknown function (DUF3308).
MIQRLCTILLLFAVLAGLPASGQDARVLQYQSIPMLFNPAQTGDYEGDLRVMVLYSYAKSDSGKNILTNFSIDKSFGKDGKWAVGLNYMRSGHSDFNMSGGYLGASVARAIRLDKENNHRLRVGLQVSWLSGKVDETKGAYDHLLDVNAFRYKAKTGHYKGSADYLNLGGGIKYQYVKDAVRFETGIGVNNLTHPNYLIMEEGSYSKRLRVSTSSLFQYQFNPRNAIRLEYLSWKEGIFARHYDPEELDVDIHESLYSISWIRNWDDASFTAGLNSRSWKAIGALVHCRFTPEWGLGFGYEHPLLKKYYSVSRFEISATFQPF